MYGKITVPCGPRDSQDSHAAILLHARLPGAELAADADAVYASVFRG
jgi:hypothetical protein